MSRNSRMIPRTLTSSISCRVHARYRLVLRSTRRQRAPMMWQWRISPKRHSSPIRRSGRRQRSSSRCCRLSCLSRSTSSCVSLRLMVGRMSSMMSGYVQSRSMRTGIRSHDLCLCSWLGSRLRLMSHNLSQRMRGLTLSLSFIATDSTKRTTENTTGGSGNKGRRSKV